MMMAMPAYWGSVMAATWNSNIDEINFDELFNYNNLFILSHLKIQRLF